MNITTNLIPIGTKRRSGKKIDTVKFFVDHDTGNPNSTAKGNVSYFINSANDMSASAHVFIDDKDIIICIPCLDNAEKAWHVRYNVTADNHTFGCNANDNAIGLELCYFRDDKVRTQKAYDNYVEFAAYLAKYHNVNPNKRMGHFELDPSRKIDPSNALSYINKTYDDMKKDIMVKYNELYAVTDNKAENTKDEQTISEWSKIPQKWVIDNSISDGLRPKDIATREEIWAMLYRFNQIK